MKTKIIERQRNFDKKKFVPQYRTWYWLFFIIPIPIWKDFEYEYGDACLLGLPLSSHEFDTWFEAERFLRIQKKYNN